MRTSNASEKNGTICPESTIESANRRSFIKNAALATASVGIGGSLIGSAFIPESNAKSATTVAVQTDTPCCNAVGNLAIFNGSASITGGGICKTVSLSGGVACGPILCVYNGFCCSGVAIRGTTGAPSGCLNGIGIQGLGGVGVCGTSFPEDACCPGSFGGVGVRGIATGVCRPCCSIGVLGCATNGVAVSGSSRTGVAFCGSTCISTIARLSNRGGGKNKSANLQFQNGCYPSSSWYAGVGGAGNSHGVTNGQFYFLGSCEPRLVLNKCGKIGIGTITPNTTLQVGGGVSFETKIETANYTMTSSDFAILANASSKALTITLPSASNTGQVVHVKKIDSSKNGVTVSRQGSNTIEGVASKLLSSEYDSLTLIAGGNGIWYILSNAV